jgi:hypothetical protein
MIRYLRLAVFALLLMGCWQPTTTQNRVARVLGLVEAKMDVSGSVTANFVQSNSSTTRDPLPDNAITFKRKFSSSFEDESTKERYLSATFEVTNATETDFKNLTLYSYAQAVNSLGGTAIKTMVNFGGSLITDNDVARNIKPTHGMKHSGVNVIINPEEADFQAFKDTEAESLQTTALQNGTVQAEDRVLEYGFVARSQLGGRAIAAKGKGLVTIAVKLPKPATKDIEPYKFVMTFVLADDSITRVTRSAEESTQETETRAYYDAQATEAVLIGSDAEWANGLTNIRVPNVKIGTAPTFLLPTRLSMASAVPNTFNNDVDTTLVVQGQEFTPDTSFFIQSTKLQIQNITSSEATLIIPKGLLPSVYGLMAVNPDGTRATLYPAFSLQAGAEPEPIDPQKYFESFVDGYVIDYTSKRPIANAKVSMTGMQTTTGQDGYYMFRGVPPGRQAIRIEADNIYNPFTGENFNYEPVYRIAESQGTAQTLTMKLAELERKSTFVSMIGPAGGTHYASDQGKDGPFLVIPPGALDRDVPIQFTHLRAANTLPELPQDGYNLAFAHLAPTGLVFKKPATLFLPLQAGVSLAVGTKIHISYFDAREVRWVDDITSGVISRINGKLFLEYEINHFTWIGGSWRPDPVNGCVVDQNGKPVAGVTTNWGITDEKGEFVGSTTSSDIGRILTAYAILPDGTPTASVEATYDGRSSANFMPCIVYQIGETKIEGPEFEEQTDGEGASPYNTPTTNTRGVSTRAAAPELRDVNGIRVFMTRNLKSATFTWKDWRSGSRLKNAGPVDQSTVKVFVREKDVTKYADVKVFDTKLEFKILAGDVPGQPFKAGTNVRFRIEGWTKKTATQSPVKFEQYEDVHLIAGFQTTSLTFASSWDQNNDGNFPYWDLTEPVATLAKGRMAAFYSPETGVENFTTRFPVLAVDEAAKTLGINFSSVSFEPDAATQGVTNIGTAPMQNGIAYIPVTFTSSDPKTIKLALARKGLKIDSSASITPDPRVKPRLVVLIAYEVVVVGVAAVSYASAVILEQLSKQRGAVLPEVDFSGLTSWFAEAGNKIQSAVATVTNYVTIAVHANGNGNANTITAPFPRIQAPTISPTSPCYLPNYMPPTGQALQDLKNNLRFADFNTFKAVYKGVSSLLEKKLFSLIFKSAYLGKFSTSGSPLFNQINGTFENIIANSSLRWLRNEEEYNDVIRQFGKAGNLPQRFQAFGHLRNLISISTGIVRLLQNMGDVDKQSTDCYNPDELDGLHAILDLINDLIDQYNSKL